VQQDRLLTSQNVCAEGSRDRNKMKTGREMLVIAKCHILAIVCFEALRDGIMQQTERNTVVIREV
jgi:hypothetical protein